MRVVADITRRAKSILNLLAAGPAITEFSHVVPIDLCFDLLTIGVVGTNPFSERPILLGAPHFGQLCAVSAISAPHEVQ